MSEKYNELKSKLKEMFQLDQTELNFGIYKIMNQKAEEVESFLQKDLPAIVKDKLNKVAQAGNKEQLENQLEEAIKQAQALGANPDDLPKVKELKAQLAQFESAQDLDSLENEVFSNLTKFFSRYYDGGDFLSRRKYKKAGKECYMIPYNGEEVKLHWANADQYYIKSSEYFKDYSFKLSNDKTVHLQLVEAEGEKDNNKKDRNFALCEEDTVCLGDGELYIRYSYTPDNAKRTKDTSKNEVEAVKKVIANGEYADFSGVLELKSTPTNKTRTLLEKHITDYTSKNSFDYFIHKDLGGFLTRELDFYIKNEVLFLEDLDDDKVKSSLAKARAIKEIAEKIILFLAQLENFQKKMWLKKKLVVETNYCMTLDKVPEELYPAIITNEAQIKEWEKLFAISEIKTNLTTISGEVLINNGGDAKNKLEFLRQNPYLVLDTMFYSTEFKYILLSSIDNLEEQTNGLLINADNFHALNLLQEKYQEQIKCCYIDPPYNTGDDGFIYKDSYQHSSWISLISDRVKCNKRLMQKNGVNLFSIGNDEEGNARQLLDSLFLKKSIPFVWKSRAKPTNAGEAIYQPQKVAEFVFMNLLAEKTKFSPLTSGEIRKYPHSDKDGKYRTTTILTSNLGRYKRETMRFEIADYTPPEDKRWKAGYEEIKTLYETNRLGFNDDGEPFRKQYDGEEEDQHIPLWTYLPEEITGTAESGKSDLSSIIGNTHGLDSVKPKELICTFLNAITSNEENDIIIDYFAGSGTTGHAVINLNREDEGNRKFILVEMGKHFDNILKPRIKNIIYSKDWKDGKPLSREGSSHLVKYVKLESYEDTLNNLELSRTEKQQNMLDKNNEVYQQYFLNYMLDLEAKDSVINIDMFKKPFDYVMKINNGTETQVINVDLVETFNYLIGLYAEKISSIKGYVKIEGKNRDGEKILVIWRDQEKHSNEDLDEFCRKLDINTKDFMFNKVFVNGDNNLENMRVDEANWKLTLIEEEFKKRMFDVQAV